MTKMLAFAALLLLPGVTLAGDRHDDAIDAAVQRCENSLDDAQSWVDACTAAIESRRYRDPRELSRFYSNRGFGDINLALATDRNFDKAIADLNEAVRILPENQYAFLNRANAYMYRGEFQRSLEDTDVVVRLDPKEGKAHAVRCTDFTKLNQPKIAIQECDGAIALGEQHPWNYVDLGLAYEAAGDQKSAETAYRRALSLEPGYGDAQKGLDRLARKSPR
jgi:tetratricopeptide (TPR) repeat protein